MTNQRNNHSGNIYYTREIGLQQAISIGLRASLPITRFSPWGRWLQTAADVRRLPCCSGWPFGC